MAQTNPKVTPIPINAKGGAFTDIVLTIMCSKVRVSEDPAYNDGALQGLTGYMYDTQPGLAAAGVEPPVSPNYQFVWLPNDSGQEGPGFEPISFGGSEGGRVHGAFGDYVGAQGTFLLKLTTNSANAGGVLLEEWE